MIFGFNTEHCSLGHGLPCGKPRCASRSRVLSRRCSSGSAASGNVRSFCRRIAEGGKKFRSWRGLSIAGLWRRCAGGFVDDALNETASNREQAEELVVELLGSQRVSADHCVSSLPGALGRLMLRQGGRSRRMEDRVCRGRAGNGFHNDAGVAEMRFAVADGPAELEVKARLEGRETARRFRINPQKN